MMKPHLFANALLLTAAVLSLDRLNAGQDAPEAGKDRWISMFDGKTLEQPIPDDSWYTKQVIAHGNHIITTVNDKVVVDFIDQKNT
jgi:hypothetical protein